MAENEELSFWDHLDILRSIILKVIIVGGACTLLAIYFKDPIFKIVLAPKDHGFITYKMLRTESFGISLINTELTE